MVRQAEDGPSTALVLANRSHLVEQAIADTYLGRLVRRPARQVRSAAAFRSGSAAGARADLGFTTINQNNDKTLTGRNT